MTTATPSMPSQGPGVQSMEPTTATTPHISSRVFNAPRELVWKANTEAARLSQWLSPAGSASTVKKHDLRVGGGFHYCQRSPDGSEIWGMIEYKEITPIKKLVYIQWFSDADGGITTHPMAPTWPRRMHTVIDLEDLGDSKTRLTVAWTPVEGSAEEELTIFDNARAGMDGGWKGTFDKLEAYLKIAQ